MWTRTVHESTQNCFFSWSDVGQYWILHLEINYFDVMFTFVSKTRDRCHFRLLFVSISPQVFLALQAFYYLISILIQTCCFPITIIFSSIFHFVLSFSNGCNSCNCSIFVSCKLLVLPGNIKYLEHCILWKYTRNNILTDSFYSLSWH